MADSLALGGLVDAVRAFRGRWPGGAWSWDDRFVCALSTFPSTQSAAAQAAIAPLAPNAWGAAVPGPVRDVANRTGGVRGGQQVYYSDAIEGVHAVLLWWPWGGGTTISVRVALVGAGDPQQLISGLRSALEIGG